MHNSETCLKRLLKIDKTKVLKTTCSLISAGPMYCRMLQWSILQYFGPALSHYQS